jgi:hypothetical protein
VKSEIYRALNLAFQAKHIDIPFPTNFVIQAPQNAQLNASSARP